LQSVDDVASAIDSLLDELEPAELERRTIANLGIARFRPTPPIAEIPDQAASFTNDLASRYSSESVAQACDEARKIIEGLKISKRRREMFHGKVILDTLFKRYLHSTGLQKAVFTFEAARYARRRKAVTRYFDRFFKRIRSMQEAPASRTHQRG
jgi:hypothetical protein